MLTLFHAPRSRSTRILWLLEELGADYELRRVAIRRMDGSGERDPGNPHPAGQVPVLLDGDTFVTESSAVVLYLTDLFPDAEMGRVIGDPERGAYLSWLSYYAGAVEPAVSARYYGGAKPDTHFGRTYDEMIERLSMALSQHDYVLGDRVSGADILIASIMQLAGSALPDLAVLRDHLERMEARPALARARAKDDA